LTCESYVGLSADDAIRAVFTAAGNDPERARFGMCFVDEWDKKRSCGDGGRDVAGAAVQQAFLKLVEGTENHQLGGRRGSFDGPACPISTKGMFFTFAGAFVGLDELLGRCGAHGIGFGDRATQVERRYLQDALVSYGLLPEYCNRLTAVLMFGAPSIKQLETIAIRAVIPGYARLLAAGGADLKVEESAARRMAEAALATGTYARGIKSVVARLVEDAVYGERKGMVRFSAADVDAAIEAAGLGVVHTE
jgi:ATP-dependent Clp protease ATP-binding subunit ClpX